MVLTLIQEEVKSTAASNISSHTSLVFLPNYHAEILAAFLLLCPEESLPRMKTIGVSFPSQLNLGQYEGEGASYMHTSGAMGVSSEQSSAELRLLYTLETKQRVDNEDYLAAAKEALLHVISSMIAKIG